MDISTLQDYKDKKLLRCQKHPSKNLLIWNYTDLVQCKRLWDDVTTVSRGLVTDLEGNIIARSFRKFHNIEEGRHTPTQEFDVFEKVDGSLVIVFWHESEWIVATRGSFVSPQAQHARDLLHKYFGSDDFKLHTDKTYSFEIIYPQNRIVVDYRDADELVFLTAFGVDGSEYIDAGVELAEYNIRCAKRYSYTDVEQLKALNWENAEGFVVRFSNGERVKVKFQKYLDLHRTLTNISAASVWDMLCKDPSALSIDDIPDEFMSWVEQKWKQLKDEYDAIFASVHDIFESLAACTSNRTEFAKQASKHENAKLLFMLYDRRMDDLHNCICQSIRPKDGHLDVPFCGKIESTPPLKTRRIIILVGVAGAGKSTWCHDYIQRNPNTLRVNRDTIRQQLFAMPRKAYYTQLDMVLRQKEEIVSYIELANIRTAVESGYDVVIDNTNLKKTYIDKYLKEFPEVDVAVEVFHTPLAECISRDAQRGEDAVGEEVIQKQYKSFQALKKSPLLQKKARQAHLCTPIVQNVSLPAGYVFDIDGTLADNRHRSPYAWHLVDKDNVIEGVRSTLVALHSTGYKIAICTGRDGVCEQKTREWLTTHNIPFDMFYIRPVKNKEPDWVVKERMWRDIATKINIVAIFDDRNSVVKHGRKCGLQVYQVNDGNF